MVTGTLKDIAALQNRDLVVGILDEVLSSHPEIATIPGRTITGTSYKIAIRKTRPFGGFRRANEGVDATAGTYDEKLVQAFIYENPIVVDKRVAEASEDGIASYQALRAEEHVSGALEKLANQFYYGTDTLGFPGLQTLVNETVSATGSSANATSSAYLVYLGSRGVQFVFGQNSGLEVPDFTEQAVTLDGKLIPAYYSPMGLWIGLQMSHPKSAVRIANLTTQTGKGLTDALVAQALEKMPAEFRNNRQNLRILANSQSVFQLHASRSSLNAVAYQGGAVASYPTESLNIPIVETDSLIKTEAVVS